MSGWAPGCQIPRPFCVDHMQNGGDGMPRQKKRSDGRYTVTFRHEGRRLFFYAATQAEARANADAARDRLRHDRPVGDSSHTLKQWLDEWVTTFLQASDRAASTKTMHAAYARVWIVPVLGDVRLDHLNVNDVNRMMLTMQADGRTATRRNCYTTLRVAVDDAVLNGLLAANPVHRVRQPKVTRHEARFLRPGEVTALLTAAATLRYGPILCAFRMKGAYAAGVNGTKKPRAVAFPTGRPCLPIGFSGIGGRLGRRAGALSAALTPSRAGVVPVGCSS